MKVYAGITIGPIVEVLCETSTPAALWFGSSMFSDITRRVCLGIKNEWPEAQIYSPYFDVTSAENYPSDGVGKYHDRVIFSVANDERKECFIADFRDGLRELIENVKMDTVKVFPKGIIKPEDSEKAKGFLKKFLQIHFVIMPEDKAVGSDGTKNAILTISPYLDELELMKSFPATSEQNIILDFFGRIRQDDALKDKAPKNKSTKDINANNESGEEKALGKYGDYGINDYIRKAGIFIAIKKQENTFLSDYRFRTLLDIANAKNELTSKHAYYYAVVSADGDGMGKFLKSISTDEVTLFSKGCLEYNEKAASMVARYGGMPIYAGGDDLLFIAPVYGMNATDGSAVYIFDICREINDKFMEIIRGIKDEKGVNIFENNKNIPSISFGIAMQYYTYPLYEAFENSRNMLETVKNGTICKEKNSIGISLQKHSGQSLKVFVGNGADDYGAFKAFFEAKGSGNQQAHSILYNLDTFSALYEKAYKDAVDSVQELKNAKKDDANELNPSDIDKIKASFENIWKNLSDNSEQKKYWPYIKYVADKFFDGFVARISRISLGDDGHSTPLEILKSIIRLEKFYLEKAGEE